MTRRLILLLLACVAFFPHNTALRPDIMECRNLVTAHEIASGECTWLVPTMNGALRLEKPPLPTWIAAAVESISPDNLALQRVPPALSAMLWTLFLFLLVRRLTDEETAFWTALAFLTCYQVVLMGRTATWDVYCHAFMTGALLFLHRIFCPKEHENTRWRDAAIAGLFLGLSFLSKGPVSFFALLLPFLIAFPLLPGFSIKGKWLPTLLAVAICIALSSWWYIYLYLAHPTELESMFHKETGAWTNRNVRPWYYYWRFWVEAGAWAPIVLAGLFFPYWKRRLKASKTYLFVLIFLLAQLILLSLMPEKKFRYLLPMMLPMAMLTGLLLVHWHRGGSPWPKRVMVGVLGVFTFVELLAMPLVGRLFTGEQPNTLALLRHDHRTDGLSYHYPAGEELRIEVVHAAGRKIQPLDLSDTAAVRQALPCVLLTHPEATDSLLGTLPNDLRFEKLGTFDNNHHPPTAKHYNTAMRYDATVVRKR